MGKSLEVVVVALAVMMNGQQHGIVGLSLISSAKICAICASSTQRNADDAD
jgi:hypothetical protein